MRNVNDAITLKYCELLGPALSPIPGFRDGYVPDDLIQGVDAYWMVSAISNSDNSSMQSHDTITSVQVGLYTRSKTTNNSTTVNEMASIVLSTIMPGTVCSITIPDFQVLTTELGPDNSPPPFDTGSELFINRFITFNHKIFHQPDVS